MTTNNWRTCLFIYLKQKLETANVNQLTTALELQAQSTSTDSAVPQWLPFSIKRPGMELLCYCCIELVYQHECFAFVLTNVVLAACSCAGAANYRPQESFLRAASLS